MNRKTITFVGGGNMARALIAGLIDDKHFTLKVSNPGRAKREQLAAMGEIETFADNSEAIANADCVVLAVKPQIMQAVCEALKAPLLNMRPLVISIAAGIETAHLSRWLDGYSRIVRVMPNTPALIGCGASGLYGTDAVGADDRQLATDLFESSGLAIWVDTESKIDAVTSVSGSGPAYFFYFLEAMENTAVESGLSRSDAQQLARQTALGAALLAQKEPGELATLRANVTSPGGTTAEAIRVFKENKLPSLVAAAMRAVQQRARELAAEFGKK